MDVKRVWKFLIHVSGREKGLEFLIHVDLKGVLKFLAVNTSCVKGGMDVGIYWTEHVV